MIDGIDVRSTWSPSLSSPLWSGDGLTERVVDVEDDVETVEASVPMDAGKKFMRIEVER
jgi:hypothetical protein